MLIFLAKIALNAVICMILFMFSLVMESWLLRNVGFYRSLLQFYVEEISFNNDKVAFLLLRWRPSPFYHSSHKLYERTHCFTDMSGRYPRLLGMGSKKGVSYPLWSNIGEKF